MQKIAYKESAFCFSNYGVHFLANFASLTSVTSVTSITF